MVRRGVSHALVLVVTAMIGGVFGEHDGTDHLAAAAAAMPTVAGTPAGAFDVAFGAAAYSIPIEAPPGINGVAPRIALTYNSQRGNGLVGVGWSLNGIEAIGRCGATVRAHGEAGTIAYDGNDRFCISGMSLIATSGDYGAPGTEYRTDVDTWTRFVSHGTCGQGPCSFTATNKSGATLEFGSQTAGGRILAQGRSDGAVRVWSVDTWADLNGVSVTARYTHESDGGYFVDSLEYAGARRVGFEYENRNDPVTRYSGGSLEHVKKRLSRVVTYDDEGSEIRSYQLTYQKGGATQRSRVVAIQECGRAACYPATKFTMADASRGFTGFTDPVDSIIRWSGESTLALDVNGDGLADVVGATVKTDPVGIGGYLTTVAIEKHFSTGRGALQLGASDSINLGIIGQDLPPPTSVVPIDFNGDGRGDLVIMRRLDGPDPNQIPVQLYSYASNGTAFTFTTSQSVNENALTTNSHIFQLASGDVNGDGLQDIITITPVSLTPYLSQGNGTFTKGDQRANASQNGSVYLPMDLDGDGRIDLVGASSAGLRPYRAVNGGFTYENLYVPPRTITVPFLDQTRFLAADVNGDGLGDVIAVSTGASITGMRVESFIGTGARAGSAPFVAGPAFVHGNVPAQLVAANLDDDKLTDLVAVIEESGNTMVVPFYNQNGTSWVSPSGSGKAYVGGVAKAPFPVLALDLDGDASDDFLLPRRSSSLLHAFDVSMVRLHTSAAQADLLTSIENAIGGKTTVRYAPMTDPAVYTKGEHTDASMQDVLLPLPLVASYSVTDGNGGTYKYTQKYSGARVGADGIGWLGFEAITTTDDDKRSTTVEYLQTWPAAGAVARVTSRNRKDQLLTRATYQYRDVADADLQALRIHQILRSQEDVKSYDPDARSSKLASTRRRELQYDEMGNVEIVEDRGDPGNSADDRYLCTRYSNDGDSWRFGYVLAQKETTSHSGCRTFVRGTSDGWRTGDFRLRTLEYDAAMNVSKESFWDSANDGWLTSSYEHDSFGNVTGIDDPGGGHHTYTWDDTHRFMVEAASPDTASGAQLTESFEYDTAYGLVTTHTDAAGNEFGFGLDTMGRLVKESGPGPDGSAKTLRTRHWELTSSGIVEVERSRPDWTSQDFSEPPAGQPASDTWHWVRTYSDGLNRAYKTDRKSDGANPLIEREIQFDGAGNISRIGAPSLAGKTNDWTTISYDDQDRPLKIKRPDRTEETFQYLTDPLRVTHTVAAGTDDAATEVQTFDTRGRLIRRVLPNQAAIDYAYTAAGELSSVDSTVDVRQVALVWDSLGRVRSQTTSNAGERRYVYGADGRVESITDGSGNIVEYSWDLLGRPSQISESGPTITGAVTTYTYDGATSNGRGRLTKVSRAGDHASVVHTLGYDAYGRVATAKAVIANWSFLYGYDYTPQGELAAELFPDRSRLELSYTKGGNPSSYVLVSADGRQRTTYAMTSQYNEYSMPISTTYHNNLYVRRDFYREVDVSGGAILAISALLGPTYQLARSYDWSPRHSVEKEYDGINNKAPVLNSYRYDAATSYLLDGRIGAALHTFTYDSAGNRKTLDSGTGQQSYSYAAGKDQLLSGQGQTATWNANGTLATLNRDGALHEFKYHADGRLSSVTEGSRTAVYAEDASGNPVYRAFSSGGPAGETRVFQVMPDYEISYYTGTEQMFSTKTIHGPWGPMAAITEYPTLPAVPADGKAEHEHRMRGRMYEASANPLLRARAMLDLWMARSAPYLPYTAPVLSILLAMAVLVWPNRRPTTPSPARRTLYAMVARALVVTVLLQVGLPARADLTSGANGAGNPVLGVRYFVQDQVGNTISVTDESASQTASLRYLPFGLIEPAGTTGTDDFRPKFGGKRLDEATGFYDFGSRMMDPRSGRFTTPDPGWQYMNPYLYGGNNPASTVDPDGEFAFIPVAVFAVATLLGAYSGGVATNGGRWNPARWDWSSGSTYAGIFGGAAIGAIGFGVAAGLASATVLAAAASVGLNSAQVGLAGAIVIGAGEGAAFAAMGGGDAAEIAEGAAAGAVLGGLTAGLAPMLSRGIRSVTQTLGRRAAAAAETAVTEGVEEAEAMRPCSSFPAGQRVVMADGTLRPIELVRKGDEVEGYALRQPEPRGDYGVQATRSGESERLTRIVTDSGVEIVATPSHPFRGYGMGWIAAADLDPEMSLVDDRGHAVPIRSVQTSTMPGRTPVYNFTVGEAGTYYVSEAHVLVHNAAQVLNCERGAAGQLRRLEALVRYDDLDTGTGTTKKTRAFTKKLGKILDDAGHALARRLGGLGNDEANIFAQARSTNRGQYRVWEGEIYAMINQSKYNKAYIQIDFIYENSTATRPIGVDYWVEMKGKWYNRYFENP